MKIFVNKSMSITAMYLVGLLMLSIIPTHTIYAGNKDKSEGERVWFQGQSSHGDGGVALYTVPAGSKFVLTDIIVTASLSSTTGVLGAIIYNDPLSLPTTGMAFSVRYRIDTDVPGAHITVNLSSGANFNAGDVLVIGTAHNGPPPGNSALDYWIGGMLFSDPSVCTDLICPGG